MPHNTIIIDHRGPILPVVIGISAQRKEALIAEKQILPPTLTANMLVDTGASVTCLSPKLINKLGLEPKGSILGQTPSTDGKPHTFLTYDVEIVFPGDHSKIIPAHPIVCANFSSQGHDGLIGRDILQMARFIYSGPDNMAMLSLI